MGGFPPVYAQVPKVVLITSMRNGTAGHPHTEFALPYCEKCAQQQERRLNTLQKKVDCLQRTITNFYDQWATNRRSVAVQTVTSTQFQGRKTNDSHGIPARGYKYKLMRLQSEVDDLREKLATCRAQLSGVTATQVEPRCPTVNPDITEYIYKVSNRAARFELSIQRLHELVGLHKQDALRKTEEIVYLRAQSEELLHLWAQHLRHMDCRILQAMLDNAQWLADNLNFGEQAIRVANDRAVAFEVVNQIQNRLICELQRQIEPYNHIHLAQSGSQVVPIAEVHRLEAQVRHLQLLLADKGVTIGECNDELLSPRSLPCSDNYQ